MSTTDNSTVPATGTWVIDQSHSSVEFVARHMMFSKVKGRFKEFSGLIEIRDNAAESSVMVNIDASSIDTHEDKRDQHLRSEDFLDVDNYKQIAFKSKKVDPIGQNMWAVMGDLNIRGETRPVSLEVSLTGVGKNPWDAEVAGFAARTQINRKDFGLEWNVALEAGGVLVGDEVQINLEIEAIRQV